MGLGLGVSSDDHELRDDADEAGLETTGGKIITPGATTLLSDDAAEDDDLRGDAAEDDDLRDDAAEDDDLRDDAAEDDPLLAPNKGAPFTDFF